MRAGSSAHARQRCTQSGRTPRHVRGNGTARGLRRKSGMLRITAEQRDALWVLKLEGRLQGAWVGELRNSWRRIRDVTPGAPIRVELADVQFMDTAGKVLLAEMHHAGVEIIAH